MIRKLLAVLALVAVAAIGACEPAVAQAIDSGDASVAPFFTFDRTLVLVLTGFGVPFVNGLLLKASNPAWVKVLAANLFGTAVHAFMQVVGPDGAAIFSRDWLLGLGLTLATMTVTYLGYWRPVVDPNATAPTVLPVGDLLAGRRAA